MRQIKKGGFMKGSKAYHIAGLKIDSAIIFECARDNRATLASELAGIFIKSLTLKDRKFSTALLTVVFANGTVSHGVRVERIH